MIFYQELGLLLTYAQPQVSQACMQ